MRGISNGAVPFGGNSLIRIATSSAFQFNPSLNLLTVTNASTTNFSASGSISLQGWKLSTSTVVCMAPEQCQFQADGTDDDVTIQAAIDSFNPTGGTVVLKTGDYNISSTIQMRYNVTLLGSGYRTTILPVTDVGVFNMLAGQNRVKNLRVYATNMLTYSSAIFTFEDNLSYGREYMSIEDVTMNALPVSSTTLTNSIGIKISTPNGSSVSWLTFRNVSIIGFNYGIYMNSTSTTGYVNANRFYNFHLQNVYEGIYLDNQANGVDGNYFQFTENGASNINRAVYCSGLNNVFESSLWDLFLVPDRSKMYTFTASSSYNYVTDNLMTSPDYTDDGTNNTIVIQGGEIKRGQLKIGGTGIDSSDAANNALIAAGNGSFFSGGTTGNLAVGRNFSEKIEFNVNDEGVELTSDQDENTPGFGWMKFVVDDDSTADGYFSFTTKTGNEIMRINPVQEKITIGTTTLTRFSQVLIQASSTNTNILEGYSSAGVQRFTFSDTGNLSILPNNANTFMGNSANNGVRFDGSGKFGLSVNSATGIGIIVDSDNNSTAASFFVGTNNIDPDSATKLLTVLESGNVGINTTIPSTTLHVIGTTTSSNLILSGLSTNTSGNAICIVGTTVVTAGGTTCITSSGRFKEDIEPLTKWKDILDIKVVSYNYKSQYADDIRDAGGKRLGFIAEQIETVDPQLVQYDAEGNPLSVHFDGITAKTVLAIQEMKKEIDSITGTAEKSAQDNWQWIMITILFLIVGTQQYQLNNLKREKKIR